MNDAVAATPRTRLRERLRTPSSVAALAAFALVAVCLVLCAICELWFLHTDTPVGFDEGYIGALALRLLNGGMLPGVDAVGQRGPVFYWTAAVAQALFGRYHWFGFRYVTWLAASVVVLSLLGLGMLARKPLAGAIGASFYVWICFAHYQVGTGASLNGEQLIAPMLCGAALAAEFAMRRERARAGLGWAALAGFLAGLAGWTKITLLGAIAPLVLWAVITRVIGLRASVRSSVPMLASMIAGWLVPAAAVPLIYVAAGEFDQLVYRFFTYNRDIYMGAYGDRSLWAQIGHWCTTDPVPAFGFLGCVGLIIGGIGYLAGLRRRDLVRAALADHSVIVGALLLAMVTFATGIAQMRFWGHHFIVAMPWVGLLVGLIVAGAVSAFRGRVHALIAIGFAGALIAVLVQTVGSRALLRDLELRAGHHAPAGRDPLCAEIHRYASPQDTIFIWGFDGDLYVSCARNPASRFVYMTLVAGIVPPFWTEPKREWEAKDARAQTEADLKQAKPVLILDMPKKLGDMSINKIIELKQLVRRQYCSRGSVKGYYGRTATFYARKDRGYCGKSRTSSK